jgi:malate/lactate dehydrogenase
LSLPIIAIVGAGDLGGALASTLAMRDGVGEVRLIDESGSSAAGKALDVQQSTPVHGAAVRLTGSSMLDAVEGADVVVLADACGSPAGSAAREHQGEAALVLLRRLSTRVPSAPLLLAGAAHAWLVERAVSELALSWTRVIGTAPAAMAAAVRTLVGLETGASPLDVHLSITGLPPAHLVVAWESASLAGASLTAHLDYEARARIARRLPLLWPPGPIALAAAAAAAIDAITRGSHRPHVACLAMDESLGADTGRSRTRRAIVVQAYLTSAGVARATLPDLSTQERLALDNVRLR